MQNTLININNSFGHKEYPGITIVDYITRQRNIVYVFHKVIYLVYIDVTGWNNGT